MSVVFSDIIEGNSANLSFNGWEFTRIFTVGELTGAGYQMTIEAYNDPGVPKMNDGHPEIPDAYVVDVVPESLSDVGDAIRLIYTYRQFTPNVRISIRSRKLNSDRYTFLEDQSLPARTHMLLGYKYPDVGDTAGGYSDIYLPVTDRDTASPTFGEGITDVQGVLLQVSETRTDFTYSRTEWLTNAADLLNGYPIGFQLTGSVLAERARLFNDKLNLAGWSVFPTDLKGVWKCNIVADSSGNGFDWRVTYNFEFDPFSWVYRGTFNDGITNQPVDNGSLTEPVLNPSIKDFDQYQTIDFDFLGIT
jgi:hypothetical protein